MRFTKGLFIVPVGQTGMKATIVSKYTFFMIFRG